MNLHLSLPGSTHDCCLDGIICILCSLMLYTEWSSGVSLPVLALSWQMLVFAEFVILQTLHAMEILDTGSFWLSMLQRRSTHLSTVCDASSFCLLVFSFVFPRNNKKIFWHNNFIQTFDAKQNQQQACMSLSLSVRRPFFLCTDLYAASRELDTDGTAAAQTVWIYGTKLETSTFWSQKVCAVLLFTWKWGFFFSQLDL